jgi:hypothetical protein
MSGDIKELCVSPYIKRRSFLYSFINNEKKLFDELKKLIPDLEKHQTNMTIQMRIVSLKI